ncbi:MAG: hypothetical protein WCJ54_08805 [Actinomycetota bacterium]
MKKWIIIIIILAALLFVSGVLNFYQLGVSNGKLMPPANYEPYGPI